MCVEGRREFVGLVMESLNVLFLFFKWKLKKVFVVFVVDSKECNVVVLVN